MRTFVYWPTTPARSIDSTTARDGSVDSSIDRRSPAAIWVPAGRSRTTWRTATRRSAVENTNSTTPIAISDNRVPTAMRTRDRDEGLKLFRGATATARNASARVVFTDSVTASRHLHPWKADLRLRSRHTPDQRVPWPYLSPFRSTDAPSVRKGGKLDKPFGGWAATNRSGEAVDRCDSLSVR